MVVWIFDNYCDFLEREWENKYFCIFTTFKVSMACSISKEREFNPLFRSENRMEIFPWIKIWIFEKKIKFRAAKLEKKNFLFDIFHGKWYIKWKRISSWIQIWKQNGKIPKNKKVMVVQVFDNYSDFLERE